MDHLNNHDVKDKAVRSFVTLTGRQVALNLINLISINVIIARILPVEVSGVFNIASSIIAFFTFFSDIGLAAALIQKKETISPDDIKTTFTIQQILVGLLSLMVITGAPWLAQFYGLNTDGAWLIRALGLAFFLSSLKVVPSVLQERNLNFGPIVTVDVAETVIFNVLLVVLAVMGYGLWSFTVAALVRGVVGVILIYLIAPVRVGFGIKREAARQLLSFGIPFQLNSFLALLKDQLVLLLVARMVGPLGIGYISWSQKWAFAPLVILNTMVRVTFPAFSRLRDEKESLTRGVEKSLFVTSLVVCPMIFGLAAILPEFIRYVVTSKWLPALPSFYLFAFSALFAVVSTTFTNTLNAVGHIRTTLKLMVFWTVITWILTPILVIRFGFLGVGITSFLISFTSIVSIYLLKKVLGVKVLSAVLLPIAASVIMFLSVYTFSHLFVRNWVNLVEAVIFGGLIYAGLVFTFGKQTIIEDLKSLRQV